MHFGCIYQMTFNMYAHHTSSSVMFSQIESVLHTLLQEDLVESSLEVFILPSEFSCLAQPSL